MCICVGVCVWVGVDVDVDVDVGVCLLSCSIAAEPLESVGCTSHANLHANVQICVHAHTH